MFPVFVDLDGTIADNRHRSDLLPSPGQTGLTSDWARFNSELINDQPIPLIMSMVRMLAQIPTVKLIYLTYRPEYTRGDTIRWLHRHNMPMLSVPMLMRNELDVRPAANYKVANILWYLGMFTSDPYSMEFGLIDDDQNICAAVLNTFSRAHIINPDSLCSAVINNVMNVPVVA